MCIYVTGFILKLHAYIYLPMSPTSLGQVAAMLRFYGSMSNLPLLTTGDYYCHSHDKMVKVNGHWAGIWYGYWWV